MASGRARYAPLSRSGDRAREIAFRDRTRLSGAAGAGGAAYLPAEKTSAPNTLGTVAASASRGSPSSDSQLASEE